MSARPSRPGRIFAPSLPWAVVACAAVLACLALARWQWERGLDRREQWAEFAAAEAALPAHARALAALPRYRRVALTGRYDPDRQFLLDNRTRDGRAGFEVLTPLELGDGRWVLVNRGWLPFSGYRDRLPDVAFRPAERVTVTGRLSELPAAGLARGRAGPSPEAKWPKLASFPTFEQLERAYGQPLERRIVLLDEAAPHGYRRDWRPPGIEPARHFAYAVQWWAFAALAAGLWIGLSFRRRNEGVTG